MSRADFLTHALSLSQQLPAQAYAINLCQDRYLFMVAYLAVLLRQQITLLPSNQAPQTIQHLLGTYHASYCIRDISNENKNNNPFLVSWDLLNHLANADLTGFKNLSGRINIHQPISIFFTSGSSGEPKAIIKTWAEFQSSAQLALLECRLCLPPQFLYLNAPLSLLQQSGIFVSRSTQALKQQHCVTLASQISQIKCSTL